MWSRIWLGVAGLACGVIAAILDFLAATPELPVSEQVGNTIIGGAFSIVGSLLLVSAIFGPYFRSLARERFSRDIERDDEKRTKKSPQG